MLVEHQAVGHTTLAQYSNCTRDIVLDFLMNSQVGYLLATGWYLTERVALQLPPQQHTKCAPNSNDFFPDIPAEDGLALPKASIRLSMPLVTIN